MAVYIDDMRRSARVGRITARWSHLFADSRAELDEFAARVGMRPEWIQHPGTHREHYDLTDPRRDRALRLGATPITYPRGVADLMAARRLSAEGGEDE